MRIEGIMVRDVVIADPSLDLVEAARRMKENNVGMLVVLEDDRIVGQVTLRRLVFRGLAADRGPESVTVGDILDPDPLIISPKDELFHTVREMSARKKWYAIAADRDLRPLGVLAVDDVMAVLVAEIGNVADVITRYSKLL